MSPNVPPTFSPASIGGSAAFDFLEIRRPTEIQAADAVFSQLPDSMRQFAVVGLHYSAKDPKSGETRVAESTLALRAPLYAVADFEKAAIRAGDNPAAYADALAQRNQLPLDGAPTIPDSTVRQTLYAVSKPTGKPFNVELTFNAAKAPRGWALSHCYNILKGHRKWQFCGLKWANPASSFGGDHPKIELSKDAIFEGEESGETLLQQYVVKRQAFMKAIADQEWASIERAADEPIRRQIELTLKPRIAFVVKSTKVDRVSAAPSLSPAPQSFEATVVIDQTTELFARTVLDRGKASKAQPEFHLRKL